MSTIGSLTAPLTIAAACANSPSITADCISQDHGGNGNIRNCPRGIDHEGAADAFVTCSFYSQGNGIKRVRMYVPNREGVDDFIQRTGVNGAKSIAMPFSVKTVDLPTSGSPTFLERPSAD